MNIKRIKCILTGGCRFRDSAISECDDKEKTCTITETCCKCGKKYTAVFTYKQLGMVKKRYWVDAEEFVCNMLADYGCFVIGVAKDVLGNRFTYVAPVGAERMIA